MPTQKGDFNWAVQEIAKEVGPAFVGDRTGIEHLHRALYEGSNTYFSHSPEQQQADYHAFQDYMMDMYNWDWEDNFDWDSYRDWYE